MNAQLESDAYAHAHAHADMQMSHDDLKDATSNAYTNFGNSSSLNNINSIVDPTINANKKPNGSHIQSAMMMSHMI